MVMRYKSVAVYQRRLKRLEKSINSNSGRAVKKVAEWGAVRAAQLAPRDTGTLVNNIVWKGGRSTQAQIIQFNPGYDNPNRAGKNYNYAMAMARNVPQRQTPYSAWLASKVKGDPDYMEHAAIQTKTRFGEETRASVRNAIKDSQ